MDRLDELSVFLAILDGGSLAAASKRLHRSPPAITRALASLEERAGVRLLERTTRRTLPTDAGRQLASQARSVLAGYADTMRDAGSAALRGMLHVAAPVVFGRRHVAPVLASFLAAHEEMRAELTLSDRNADLIEEGHDLAIRIGTLADSSLVARRVGEVRRVLVASPAYLAARGTPERPSDLAGQHSAFASSRPVPAEWRFLDGGRVRVVRLSPRFIANDIEAELAALREGSGIGSALSYQVADDVAAGRLVRLLRRYEPAPLPVQLVIPGGRFLPPRVWAFLDHAAPRLAALPVLQPEPPLRIA